MADEHQAKGSEGRTSRPPQLVPATFPGQLSREDYENIWLRIKDRYWLRILGTMSLFATLGAAGGYGAARHLLDEAVVNYAKTDEFKTRIAEYTQENMPALKEEVAALEERERVLDHGITARQQQLATMESLPVKITRNSLIWITAKGDSFHMEHGHASVTGIRFGERAVVKFDVSFTSPPVVVLTPVDAQASRSSQPYSPTSVTNEAFAILGGGTALTPESVDWIAVGR